MSRSVPDPKNERGGRDPERYRHTRISSAWAGVVVAVIFGVALIDFIAQNTRHVRVEFFWVSGKIPVAVALLGAALAGAVLVLAIGIARVAQLRLKIRRQRRGVSSRSRAEENEHDHVVNNGDEAHEEKREGS